MCTTLLCVVTDIVLNVGVKNWLFDFEATMIHAHQDVLLHSAASGCFFIQAVHRKMDSLGWRQHHLDDSDFRHRVMAHEARQCPSETPTKVKAALEEAKRSYEAMQELTEAKDELQGLVEMAMTIPVRSQADFTDGSRRCVEESKTKQRHDVTTPSSLCVFFH